MYIMHITCIFKKEIQLSWLYMCRIPVPRIRVQRNVALIQPRVFGEILSKKQKDKKVRMNT